MGYVMEYYSISLDAFRINLMDAGAQMNPAQERYCQANSISHATWVECRDALSRLVDAPLQKPKVLEQPILDVFLAIVRCSGVLCGSLDHASASAEEFTSQFLGENSMRKAFHEPRLGGYLLNRSYRGLSPPLIPSWGWLDKGELPRLVASYKSSDEFSESVSEWLDELFAILDYANRIHIDLFTIYV